MPALTTLRTLRLRLCRCSTTPALQDNEGRPPRDERRSDQRPRPPARESGGHAAAAAVNDGDGRRSCRGVLLLLQHGALPPPASRLPAAGVKSQAPRGRAYPRASAARQVFGKDGWLDMSHDFNWRVNYSGFAAIAAVQVPPASHLRSRSSMRASKQARPSESAADAWHSRALTVPRGCARRL